MEAVSLALVRALCARDQGSKAHCDRVHYIATEVGKLLGLGGVAFRNLQIAALCHDIGKIGIPDAILCKPGPLTEDEFVIMQTHSIIGQEIISSTGFGSEAHAIGKIIRQHHERMDGSGYPDNLAGDQISIESRIVGLADFYDALHCTRPYRPGVDRSTILDMIAATPHHWDPAVLAAFHRLIESKTFQHPTADL